jgi:hypothetical protein
MWVTAWIGGSMATVTSDKDVTALLVRKETFRPGEPRELRVGGATA